MNKGRLLGWMLAWLLGSFAGGAWAQGRYAFDSTPGHLTKQVVPSRYALRLDLDPDRDGFAGQLTLTLRVRSEQPHVELHAHELTAGTALLRSVSGSGSNRALQVTPQPESQTWRLAPVDGRPIAAGDYRLAIAYTGKVNVSGEGLFVAPYEAGGRKQRWLATQLEAIHARKLFPGFDEPAFRAVFEITVRAPRGHEVLSNMPRTRRMAGATTTEHRFAPTPPMPTYLVAVAVGRFDVLEGRAAGVPLRILTAPGKRALAHESMRTTRQVLPHFSRYFGLPYALPKLDQLAVPSTRWGAMEDWGLISYAEDDLLVDPQRSSPRTVRNVYAVVAHEIAHQWFGNLVTAASWEEIWLNEAFATWLERKTSAHFNPGWMIPLQNRLPIDEAMALDAGAATRAIRSGPVRESAVSDVFDRITYAKGGSVLTMLEQLTGSETFRRGLVAYMKGQRLSNATAADLWHYMGQAAGRDIGAVAASWTDQPGFPLVQVDVRCEQGRQQVELAQSRYSHAGPSAATPLWKIPVHMARGGQSRTVLMETARHTLDLGNCSETPVLVNAGGVGFYRVAYDTATQRALTQHFAELPQADRVTLLSDTHALMQSGRLPVQAYLDLLEALPRVADPSRSLLWSVARSQLRDLDIALAGRPAQQALRALGRRLLAPQLERLGWSPAVREDAQAAELRGTLVELLASFDHEPTILQARRAFDDDEAGIRSLPSSLRDPVTVAVGMHADPARHERLLARLKAASGEEERWMLMKALAGGRDAARAEALLALSLAGVLPANVASSIPYMVAQRSPFGEQAYRYALEHWKALAELAGSWGRVHLLPGAASGSSDPARAARLLEDQRRVAGADGDTMAARAADAIRLRAALRERAAPALERAAD